MLKWVLQVDAVKSWIKAKRLLGFDLISQSVGRAVRPCIRPPSFHDVRS